MLIRAQGMTHDLSSAKNERVKSVLALADAKERKRRGAFAVEGAREIERALRSGFEPLEVYACPEELSELARSLLSQFKKIKPLTIAPHVFAKLAMRDGSDGLIAVFPTREQALTDLALSQCALLLAVEGMEKPGNLGALLRTADGAGCDAVIVLDQTVDPWNPNAVRASLGTVFHVPVIAATTAAFHQFCVAKGLRVAAAALHTRSKSWHAATLSVPSVILLGSEKAGLSDFWLQHADELVQLPMKGIADSLNVAAAGAALLYEAVRQRAVLKD